jgi:hypothetical protein
MEFISKDRMPARDQARIIFSMTENEARSLFIAFNDFPKIKKIRPSEENRFSAFKYSFKAMHDLLSEYFGGKNES